MVERDLAAVDPAAVVHVRVADAQAAVDPVGDALVADDPAVGGGALVAVDPRRSRKMMVKNKVLRYRA